MFRCDVCGRLLAGLRADHPIHCRIQLSLPLPVVRVRIQEGSATDPLAESVTSSSREDSRRAA